MHALEVSLKNCYFCNFVSNKHITTFLSFTKNVQNNIYGIKTKNNKRTTKKKNLERSNSSFFSFSFDYSIYIIDVYNNNAENTTRKEN
jgi:hypothetical protein